MSNIELIETVWVLDCFGLSVQALSSENMKKLMHRWLPCSKFRGKLDGSIGALWSEYGTCGKASLE